MLVRFLLITALALSFSAGGYIMTSSAPTRSPGGKSVEISPMTTTGTTPKFGLQEQNPITKPKVTLRPALVPICACESGGGKTGTPRQFDENGEVLRGKVNHLDVGMCQVNLKYHQKTAERMGLDLLTEEGNITYANFLYDTQGTRPWTWSRPCWE